MRRMQWAWTIVAAGAVGGGVTGPAGGVGAQEPPTSTTTVTAPRPVEAVPSVREVAAALVEDGWYAHPDAVGDREQLDQVADRLSRGSDAMGFALLATEPPGSSTRFAEDVLDEVLLADVTGYPWTTTTPTTGAETGATSTTAFRFDPPPDVRTVVVLSDEDVGVVSDVWGDDAIDAALDDTIDQLRDDPTDGLEALADALAAQPRGTDGEDEGTDNSGLVVAGVVLLGIVLAGAALSSSTGDLAEVDGADGSSYRRRRRFNSFSSSRRSSSSRSRSRSSSGSRRSGGSSRGRGGRRL